jgi:hypothetical protein
MNKVKRKVRNCNVSIVPSAMVNVKIGKVVLEKSVEFIVTFIIMKLTNKQQITNVGCQIYFYYETE